MLQFVDQKIVPHLQVGHADSADNGPLHFVAGEMARQAIKALRNRGFKLISVANRTVSRAEAIVAEWNGRAYTLQQLPEAIAAADVVISAVQSSNPIITQATIERRQRPLILVDIAVPRNIGQRR